MAKVTLGVYNPGDMVAQDRGWKGTRRGTVVVVKGTGKDARVKVAWQTGGETWVGAGSLMHRITATDDRPAVGPGGWLLDTAE